MNEPSHPAAALRSRAIPTLALTLVLGSLVLAGTPTARAGDKVFVGGGIGLGFGDVSFVDLSAVVGYRITPRVSAGVRLSWRNREDTRFDRDVTTNDYGASVFGRYLVKRPFFVQAEYEYLSYEFIRFDLGSERDNYTSLFVGGGVAQPVAPKIVLWVTVLYNVTYDSSDLRRPYDSPLIFRAGVGFSF